MVTAGRIAALIAPDRHAGAMVALSCETSFSAETDVVGAILASLCVHALRHRPATAATMLGQRLDGERDTVAESLRQLAGKLGENVRLSNLAHYENAKGLVGAYVHFNHRAGALLSITADSLPKEADAFVKALGMHVVWSKPTALSRAAVPAAEMERERQRVIDRESEGPRGEPTGRLGKSLESHFEKHYRAIVLPEQPWMLDPTITVQEALARALGKDARIEAFSLLRTGAGLD